jgi:hypothetical protein
MFRVLSAFGLCVLLTANSSFAADLPLFIEKAPPAHLKKTAIKVKKQVAKPKSITPQSVVIKEPDTKEVASIGKLPKSTASVAASNLSWVLGPMTANADGGKLESSNSATANIVVDRPGATVGPDLAIELEGHVVKTLKSTVRLDIQVGNVKKSLTWNADEVKSGIFKITFNEQIAVGVMPDLIPVSAIAFVTQSGNGHAAMVSLEKIMLRYSGPLVASTK